MIFDPVVPRDAAPLSKEGSSECLHSRISRCSTSPSSSTVFGFSNRSFTPAFTTRLTIFGVHVARGHHHRHVRPQAQDFFGEFHARHARHRQVGDHGLIRRGIGLKRNERRLRIGEAGDAITQALQHALYEIYKRFLVVDIENALTFTTQHLRRAPPVLEASNR